MEEEVETPRKVPERFRSFDLEGITDNPSFDPVRRYVSRLPSYLKAGVGLCLSGPNGVGKSGSLAAITNVVRKYMPAWGSRNIVWCHANNIASMYGYGKFDETFQIPVDTLYETAKWLVIDELGRETTIKNFDTRMVRLLGARTSNKLVTSFTTNLGLTIDRTALGVYGIGFISLLHQACMMLTVDGQDRRTQ